MTNTDTPSGKFYYPQDAAIDKLSITTVSGKEYDLKYLMVDLSIFEDIYSFVMSGYLLLKDGVGLIEKMNLTGNELITINFGKSSNDGGDPLYFRLYSIPSRKPVGNLSTEYIKLYFCSEELLISERTKITKSYKGKEISTIIKDILTTHLKVPPYRPLYIQSTTGVYDFNVPTVKPLETISWLSNYARPAGTSNMKLADMLFFETQSGFNFASLSTLYSNGVYKTYKYQQQNINSAIEPPSEDIISILDYEFVKTFDTLNEINSGTYANKLISLDPLTRTACTTVFNYSTDYTKNLNKGDTFSNIGGFLTDAYNSVIKMGVTNSNQMKKPYITQGSVAQDIFLETFVPNRTAQISLANYTVVKIKIPGDPFITAGKVIQFNFPSLTGGQNKSLDQNYSGKYLVTAVRHMLQSQGIYQTVLELAKESNPQYSTFSNNPLG
jgi:hypothetical protein